MNEHLKWLKQKLLAYNTSTQQQKSKPLKRYLITHHENAQNKGAQKEHEQTKKYKFKLSFNTVQ